ncbi:hypothetical protein AVEN_73589-1 [Araneus ventricosus]|uniref:Uncharacterized protein n=1 Tax=Araneus ventricosus TaxID=182803 RepID=A0A4Y2VKJ3_ARAVE|nr:hypothetical protein AVEN_73589-1 [Araneus ventricosus]
MENHFSPNLLQKYKFGGYRIVLFLCILVPFLEDDTYQKLRKAKYWLLKMLVTVMLKLHKKIGRVKAAVNSFLNNPGNYGSKQRTVRSKIISLRQEGLIQTLVYKQKCLPRKLKKRRSCPVPVEQ